uniref:gap junction alpha-9 protein n=1 Tax=Jaculus jaculus TaxID=51337 RepID=UPI001E1B4305|nr:gap junction alpha-9 protein [Jaculus jaculus]
MGDWNLLEGVLEEVHTHSTIIGKIWLTILFIFRMLVLGIAAEDVWSDEQSGFVCNTEQPGCQSMCYDRAFPISLIRYWVLQVLFVSSPSLIYMGHALYHLRALQKQRQRMKAQLQRALDRLEFEMTVEQKRLERVLCQLEQRKPHRVPLRGNLLCTYVMHVFIRSVVEVGFMIGQYLLYGFRLEPLVKCHGYPCPNIIDCFVSRPMEKTIFLLFMQSIATVSLFLNILEISYLGFKKMKRGFGGQYQFQDGYNEFSANELNQNVAKCHSTSAGPLKQLPAAHDDNPSTPMGKQMHTAAYPSSSSSSELQAGLCNLSVHDGRCILGEEEINKMGTLRAICSRPQHTDSNRNQNTHTIYGNEVKSNHSKEQRENEDVSQRNQGSHCFLPRVAVDTDNHKGRSAHTSFSLPATCAWDPEQFRVTRDSPGKPERQWSPLQGDLKGQLREFRLRTSFLPSLQGTSPQPDIPASSGGQSFEPRLVRTCPNSMACPPNNSVSPRNKFIGRRVPTDLQI